MPDEKRAGERSIHAGDDELLTVAQAAAEANARCGGGFSQKTIRRHIDKGALPVVRRGPSKRVRIRRRDFEAYLLT